MLLASEYQVRQFLKFFPIFFSTHKDSFWSLKRLMFGWCQFVLKFLMGLLIIQHLVMNKKLGLIRYVIVLFPITYMKMLRSL